MTIPSVKLMSTLGVLAPLRDIVLPMYRDLVGADVETNFIPTNVIVDQVAAGGRADLLIAISDTVAIYAEAGIVLPDTVRDLASTQVGLATRLGAKSLDISSRESLTQALLAASSIAVSQTGASGVFFRKLTDDLGIYQEIARKSVTIRQGLTAELLLSGEAELAVQQISELNAVEGVFVVGPLPPELNVVTTFTAAIFSESASNHLARSLLDAISGPLATKAYLAGGLKAPGRDGANNK